MNTSITLAITVIVLYSAKVLNIYPLQPVGKAGHIFGIYEIIFKKVL